VSLNGHCGDAIGDYYAAQAAGKRLLIFMGMVKNTRCQNGAVGRHHIPFIGKMVPAFIVVTHTDAKVKRLGTIWFDLDINHIGRAGPVFIVNTNMLIINTIVFMEGLVFINGFFPLVLK